MSEHEPKLEIVQMSGVDYFTVVDVNAPKTEFYNYGILCDGCPTREDAEQFVAEFKAEQERLRERSADDEDDEDWPFDGDGPSFGAMGLVKTLIDTGMCKDCAMRLAPLIWAEAMIPEDCICSDKCADALDRWAHPFSSFGSGRAPRRVYTVSKNGWIARLLGLAGRRQR
jgi:hypothetical protein